MSSNDLAKKLQLKPGMHALVLNAPPSFVLDLSPLPDGVEMTAETNCPPGAKGFDYVHLFVGSVEELNQRAPAAIAALRADGVLWFSYPKRSSKVETDLTRDAGWEAVQEMGMEGVAQVSIDEVWSAVRFRPTSMVKRRL